MSLDMILDKGGASVRRGNVQVDIPGYAVEDFFNKLDEKKESGPSVRLKVVETHDDVACDCIQESTMTLQAGDTLELVHTCHDGRVDRITATIVSVD